MRTILKSEDICIDVPVDSVFSKNDAVSILKNISFELYENEIVGITGESGSGKTTLAKLLTGVIPPTTGKLEFNFKNDWSGRRTKPVQILFQNSGEILNPVRKVGEMIEEALKIKFNYPEKSDEFMIASLKLVGLDESFISKRAYELSGGEQQRVALARIIAVEPEILVLDEPFSAQDVESQLNFIRLIKKISAEKKITLIIVSHDLNILKSLCNRIMILSNGKIVEIGEPSKIFSKPESDFTKQLIKASLLEMDN
ncbi:MAG: ATP-binding cassette domain-containing protein [Ignavibacteriaceae bacterium]